MSNSAFDSLQSFEVSDGVEGSFYSLPQLEKNGVGPISRLPISIRSVERIVADYGLQKKTLRAVS